MIGLFGERLQRPLDRPQVGWGWGGRRLIALCCGMAPNHPTAPTSSFSSSYCWYWSPKRVNLRNIVNESWDIQVTESDKYNWQMHRNTFHRIWEIQLTNSEKYSLQDLRNACWGVWGDWLTSPQVLARGVHASDARVCYSCVSDTFIVVKFIRKYKSTFLLLNLIARH